MRYLLDLAASRRSGTPRGITSVCSAHPVVIETTLAHGRGHGETVLIEATCNQVNQDGGYTDMTPADFRKFVQEKADACGFDTGNLILGGDHLGPNPWRHLDADAAMDKAEGLKWHLIAKGVGKGDPMLDDAFADLGAEDRAKAEAAARKWLGSK